VENLKRLAELTEDDQLKMLDGDRLEAIRSIGDDADASLSFVLWYKEDTNLLIKKRQKESGDIDNLKNVYP
jgi:uncharacterized protein (DUF2336 family)